MRILRTNRHTRARHIGRDACCHTLAVLLALAGAAAARAAHLSVTPPTLLPPSNGVQRLLCNLAWQDSWRESAGRANWDAAWLFAKYQLNGTGAWLHATLSTAAADYAVGDDQGVVASFSPADDGKGVFVFRAAPGSGNITWNDLQLIWQRTADGVADTAVVTARVFGLEMVLVPSGPFYLGDGYAGTTNRTPGAFHRGDSSNQPFYVSGTSITFTNTADGLWADGTRMPLPGGAPGPSPWGDPVNTNLNFPTVWRAKRIAASRFSYRLSAVLPDETRNLTR